MDNNSANEIILYQPDDTLALDVRVEDESVWLTQAQMAELFQTTRNNITLHTRNIFKEGELVEQSVSKESLLTAKDGKRYRTKFYILQRALDGGDGGDGAAFTNEGILILNIWKRTLCPNGLLE